MEQEILTHAASAPEGAVLSAKGLLHLGTRAAVDQALSRMARRGVLLRVGRGRYVVPVSTRFGVRAPASATVAASIAAASGETMVPSGAAEANALGLTTQVPVRSVFLTSGRSRQLRLGSQVVELRHAPPWQLIAPHRPAGRAVRALASLSRKEVPKAAARLASTLSASERTALAAMRSAVPTWMAQALSDALLPRQGGTAG